MAVVKFFLTFSIIFLCNFGASIGDDGVPIFCENKELKNKIFQSIETFGLYKWDALDKALNDEVLLKTQGCLREKFPEFIEDNIFENMYRVSDKLLYLPASNWGYGYIFSDQLLRSESGDLDMYPGLRIIKYSFSFNYDGYSSVNETFMMRRNKRAGWDFFVSDNVNDFVAANRDECMRCHSTVKKNKYIFSHELLGIKPKI